MNSNHSFRFGKTAPLQALLFAAMVLLPLSAHAQEPCMDGPFGNGLSSGGLIRSMTLWGVSNKCGYPGGCGLEPTNSAGPYYLQFALTYTVFSTKSEAGTVLWTGGGNTTTTANMSRYPRPSGYGEDCVYVIGPETTNYSGSCSNQPHGDPSCSATVLPNGDWSDSGDCLYDITSGFQKNLPGGWYCTNTNSCVSWYYDSEIDGDMSWTYYITNTAVWSTPFTDGMLWSDVVNGLGPFPPDSDQNWDPGPGVAFWSLDSCHLCGWAAKMQYEVGVPSSAANTSYVLAWNEVTTDPDGNVISTQPRTDTVYGTGGPGACFSTKIFVVNVPVFPCGITTSPPQVVSINTSGPNGGSAVAVSAPGSGGPGGLGSSSGTGCPTCGGGAQNTDPTFCVSMGGATFGQPAGNLVLGGAQTNAVMFTPAGISIGSSPPGVTVIDDASGAIRQVYAPLALADVPPPPTTNGFVINFYYTSQVSSQPSNGLYQFSGQPYVTWTVTNLSAYYTNYEVTESSAASGIINQWNCWYSSGAWTVQPQGNALQTTFAVTPVSSSSFTVTETQQPPSGQPAYQAVDTYQLFSWGWAKVQRAVGSTTAPEVTQYTYYDPAPITGGAGTTPLESVVRPDGSWVLYASYAANGFPAQTYSSFGDTPMAWYTSGRSTAYTYDPVAAGLSGSGDTGALNPYTPRLVSQTLEGQEISRQYTVFPAAGVEIDVQCISPGAAWNAASNLFTTNLFYTSGPSSNALAAVIRPNNTATFYGYGYSADGNYKTNITATGQPDSGYTHIVDGSSNVLVLGIAGNKVLQASYDVLSGIGVAQDVYSDFDSLSRPQEVTHLDGTTEQTYYGCCGLTETVDRDGVSTVYLYDVDNRLTGTQVTYNPGAIITYTNALDAGGRVLERIRVGSDATAITNYLAQYDQAGEMLYETNALGGVTSHTRTNSPTTGGLIRTTTNPDGATQTNANFVDGSLEQVSGTAVAPMQYLLGADSAGSYSVAVKLSASGGTNEWTKSYTDMARRPSSTVYAAASGAPTALENYNPIGQLTNEVDPDGVSTLYAYNLKGQLTYTVIDSNLNYQVDWSGGDRITLVTNDVIYDSSVGANVRRSRTYVWETANSPASNLVSMSETSTNGLQTWQTAYRDANTPVLTKTVTIPGTTRTQTTIAPDGSSNVTVCSYGRLASATRYDATGKQLAATTYAYDPHGRQSTVTDARNGATSYTYNNADQVATVTSPPPGTGQAAQTTTTYYDTSLRAWKVTQPDGTSLTNSYAPTSLLAGTSGSRTYPVAYTYDAQGRMQTMTTWTNYAANEGAATTTWNYDPYRGWLDSKAYANGLGPTYGYTFAGRLASRTWARGTNTTYTYNTAGDLAAVTYNDGATPGLSFGYDRRGRQSTITQGANTTTFTYNTANQVLNEAYGGSSPLAGLTVSSTYDTWLRRTALGLNTSSALNFTYGYDAASRLSTISDGNGNQATYSYLANSPLVSQVAFANSGTTRMTTAKQYDYLNRLTQISSAPSAAPAIAYAYLYDSANQRSQSTLADGSHWLYAYDSLGQVTSGKKYWSDQTPVAGEQFTYQFDNIGNRTSTGAGGDQNGENLRTATYTANNLNQYTQRTVPGYVDILGLAFATNTVTVNGQTAYRKGEYFRDQYAVNNASSAVWTNMAVGETSLTTNTGNLYVPKTPEAFAYDNDGNLTNDGRWAYTWDAENRLIAMTTNGLAAGPNLALTFGYDWRGRRVQKQASTNGIVTNNTTFVYDGWNPIGRLNAANNNSLLQSYVWGLDLSGSAQGAGGVGGLLEVNDAVNGVQFPAYDGNGNVAALVQATAGTNSAAYEYGPFGELLRATGPMAKANPFRFSTKYQDDESDLLIYPARPYSASTGRFLSRDPIEERGGFNLYSFAFNSPVNLIDAFGLCPCKCKSVKGGPFEDKTTARYYGGSLSVGVNVPWKVTVEGDINKCHCRFTDNGNIWASYRFKNGGPSGELNQPFPNVVHDPIPCTYSNDRPGFDFGGVPTSGALSYVIRYNLSTTLECQDEDGSGKISDTVNINALFMGGNLAWP